MPWFLPRSLQCFVGAAQMERKLNLRLRIILKTLLAGAMRVTRSCRRAVDKGTSVYRVRGVYLMDINQIKSRGAGRFHDTSTQGISRPSDLGSGFRWVCTLQPSYPCRSPSLPLLRLVYFGPFRGPARNRALVQRNGRGVVDARHEPVVRVQLRNKGGREAQNGCSRKAHDRQRLAAAGVSGGQWRGG